MRTHKLAAALLAIGVLSFAGAASAEMVSHDNIRKVQRALNTEGYNLSVDGVWGPNSTRALSDYQGKHGLNATGHLDRDTLAALNVEPSSRMSGSSGKSSRKLTGSTVPRSDSPSEGGTAGISHMGSGAKGSRTQTDTLTNPQTIPTR
ncbi:peptidoglycan-binding domain-containing protein [Azospirillum sp. sgz301742]